MKTNDIWPDEFTFVALLFACSVCDPNIGKQVHCLVHKNLISLYSNMLLKVDIVDMYAIPGTMDMAERVCHTTTMSRSFAARSSMIVSYARKGEIELARQLFDETTKMAGSWLTHGAGKTAVSVFREMEQQVGSKDSKPLKPEKQEETVVSFHGEKLALALAFGLMNLCEQETIRITSRSLQASV